VIFIKTDPTWLGKTLMPRMCSSALAHLTVHDGGIEGFHGQCGIQPLPGGAARSNFLCERALFAGLQVWLANLEQGTINPFIGYTTDMDIYRQFNNPRLAEMVRTNWSIRQ